LHHVHCDSQTTCSPAVYLLDGNSKGFINYFALSPDSKLLYCHIDSLLQCFQCLKQWGLANVKEDGL